MAALIFFLILIIVVSKVVDLVLMHHAYDIATELGEKPPASGLIFGFVEGFFWQRLLEITDKKQSKLLKKYIFYHNVMLVIMLFGVVSLLMALMIQSSKG